MSCFTIKPAPPDLHFNPSISVPTHLLVTSTYSCPFSHVSLIAEISQSYILIQSSNSNCISLILIFLTFFQAMHRFSHKFHQHLCSTLLSDFFLNTFNLLTSLSSPDRSISLLQSLSNQPYLSVLSIYHTHT